MKKIILLEPSIGSDNIGDQIIVEGVKKGLHSYLQNSFIIEFPTHTPINNRYFNYINKVPSDATFVCGSNLIVGNLFSLLHLRQWNIPISTAISIAPLILVGVGAQQYNQKIYGLTRYTYKHLMDSKLLHSVRDSYTEKILKKNGIENVINTGCPTMWGLDEKHCAGIPKSKAEICVTTLTDYKADSDKDNIMLQILKENYSKVFFWAQGNRDYIYFKSLKEHRNISIVTPSLEAYTAFLKTNDLDFVGTRLHGGIRALQEQKRTIIIAVDNRAREINRDFNLPIIQRESIEHLDEFINSEFSTRIELPKENIKVFLNQFGMNY